MNEKEFDVLVEKYKAEGYFYRDAIQKAKRYVYHHKRYAEQKDDS